MAQYRPPSSEPANRFLAPERDGPHGALDDVVVDFDPPIVEVAGQAAQRESA